MCNVSTRVLGTVDYKKARYIILPEHAVKQALFADSKAERTANTMTIQMSQTSMRVRQSRGGHVMDEPGGLPQELVVGQSSFITTNVFAHFQYRFESQRRRLRAIRLCALPNGRLQHVYNPDESRTIWKAGRNAPSLGESFRVRVSFGLLSELARWRVQLIQYDKDGRPLESPWRE